MNYEIIDNFLPRSQFKQLKQEIDSEDFPWRLIENKIDSKENLKKYCTFKHPVYTNNIPISGVFELLEVLISRIEFRSMLTIDINLYPIGDNIIETAPIIDHQFPHLGMIYYLDNSDGYTLFGDDFKIESVANRALLYEIPTEQINLIETNCTDKVKRTNIKFTYF